MPANPLFGQYYSNGTNKSKYLNVDYVCSSSSGESDNSFIFKDSEAQIVDSVGNKIFGIDLSSAIAKPITEYVSGSIMINPFEAKLIEGIEYGKSFKEVWFKVPYIYLVYFGSMWQDICDVEFDILLNVGLELKEYHIETSTIEPNTDKAEQIQNLLNQIGFSGIVQVTIEEDDDKRFIKFKSYVLGYDFIITNFYFTNKTISLEGREDEELSLIEENIIWSRQQKDLDKIKTQEIQTTEDNIVFDDMSRFLSNSLVANQDSGHYDALDFVADSSATHFYYDPNGDTSEDNTSISDSSDGSDGSSSSDSSVDDSSTDTKYFVFEAQRILVERSKDREVHAFKYPNGAARVWIIVPEWPSVVEEQMVSLKLNHVKDSIQIFEPVEDGHYDKLFVDVYAAERNEVERHNCKLKGAQEDFVYIDNTGTVKEITHESLHLDPHQPLEKPDITLEIHQPHVGMYRYLDYVQETGSWTNVGPFYGLVTNDDDPDTNVLNLANSIFLYNENPFPVVVKYLIAK